MGRVAPTSGALRDAILDARAVKWCRALTLLPLTLLINLGLEAQEDTQLNSDQIKQKFGSYGVEVLAQTEAMRVANLYSEHDGERVCRTLAVTRFSEPTPSALEKADKLIRAGESIGLTLRSQGWSIEKKVAAQCAISPGSAFLALSGNAPIGGALSVRVYSLTTTSGDIRADYAAIAEAYHPDHITLEAVEPCKDDIWQALTLLESEALSALLEWVGADSQKESRETRDRSNPRA